MSTSSVFPLAPFRVNNRRNRRALVAASSSFCDAVIRACTRTLASIPCLIILIIMLAYIFFEYIEEVGPIEQFDQFLKTELKLAPNAVEKFLLKALLAITSGFITYKNKIFAILAFTPMVCLRPQRAVIAVYAIVIVLTLALRSVSPALYFSTALFFWLHTQLNTDYHKALCVLGSAICVLVWVAIARSESNDGRSARRVMGVPNASRV